MPLVATRGAASAQGFGEFAQSGPVNYIENVFSTYLYTGNGSTQTITNGIDLSTYGGLVWLKSRNTSAIGNGLFDSARGFTNVNGNFLSTNTTSGGGAYEGSFAGVSSTGFSLAAGNYNSSNTSFNQYVSWTFRKQPKFFDVVTYTGNGSGSRSIAHSLGSVPGFIIVKATSTTGDWAVWHQSTGSSQGYLNTTAAFSGAVQNFAATQTSSTTFDVYGPAFGSIINTNGVTYVAYLFAHNAGGFGLTGTDNVISCGSFTADGSGNATVNLGYEPQFIIQKLSSGTGNWETYDIMRGWSQTQIAQLYPNSSSAEGGGTATFFFPTATGFQWVGGALTAGGTYIYIAIRRGPMKTPTSGSSVFYPLTRNGTASNTTITNPGFPVDWVFSRGSISRDGAVWDRLRGALNLIFTTSTQAEAYAANSLTGFDLQNGVKVGVDNSYYEINDSTQTYVNYQFRRAPGFFDEVCYTGDGVSGRAITHNLTVTPELVIIKRRDVVGGWLTNSRQLLGDNFLTINSTNAASFGGYLISNTATTFTVDAGQPNASGNTYVAYLFASCPGVSKVGSYTGNGTTQTINCGFTSGARFVLIKRTDSTGDWYVYDTARGMTTLTDPYLLLNSTAAESATLGSVTTVSTGFALNASILAAINTNGASYIFLAIA